MGSTPWTVCLEIYASAIQTKLLDIVHFSYSEEESSRVDCFGRFHQGPVFLHLTIEKIKRVHFHLQPRSLFAWKSGFVEEPDLTCRWSSVKRFAASSFVTRERSVPVINTAHLPDNEMRMVVMFNVHSMSRAGMTITCGFVRLLVADLNPTLSCLKKKINESTVNMNIIPVPVKENFII